MLKNIDIPIPPLPQQEKIVKVLDISSALIEKQKELIEKYDLFLKSKFIEMFGDPISNPMGWNVEKLGDLTQVKTGKTPSRKKLEYWNDGTVNWAKTTEVNQGILTEVEEHISDLAVKECNMIMFPKNTILIAMYGQGKTRGKVVLLGVPTTINQAFGAILKSDKFATLYLLKLLDYMYENIRDLGRGGNQENLNLDIVRGINIILPPIELQNKFASIVEKTEQIKEQETKKLEHLQTLHVSLMDKAFKGEIS
jgi:type I restriction enzyme S subunit